MIETKIESKYIEKDPPMGTEQQLERKNNDYLAYLKEKLNFILANYFRRLTDANGNINELTRTAEETNSRLTDAEGHISEISQRADGIEFTVVNGFATLKVGGRNLLRNSIEHYENTDSPVASYAFGNSIPEDNEQVTIQVAGNMGEGAESFTVYNSGNTVVLCELTAEDYDAATGVYKKTFNWTVADAQNTSVDIYSMPADASRTAKIEWVKLEIGNQATDWSPAPEDLTSATAAAQASADGAQASADQALTTTQKIEATMQFTTQGLKISGTEASRDNSYVNIGADKQSFFVDNAEVMELGADGINTAGSITAAGTVAASAFDTGHWRITESASHVWSLNYHA